MCLSLPAKYATIWSYHFSQYELTSPTACFEKRSCWSFLPWWLLSVLTLLLSYLYGPLNAFWLSMRCTGMVGLATMPHKSDGFHHTTNTLQYSSEVREPVWTSCELDDVETKDFLHLKLPCRPWRVSLTHGVYSTQLISRGRQAG